jgi:hypothetical protein
MRACLLSHLHILSRRWTSLEFAGGENRNVVKTARRCPFVDGVFSLSCLGMLHYISVPSWSMTRLALHQALEFSKSWVQVEMGIRLNTLNIFTLLYNLVRYTWSVSHHCKWISPRRAVIQTSAGLDYFFYFGEPLRDMGMFSLYHRLFFQGFFVYCPSMNRQ